MFWFQYLYPPFFVQERLDPELLKMIADALHETVQCPVCLVTLRPPVTQCYSGHGICPDCKPHITACPSCREAFIETKPIVLHQLLETLPRCCQFKTSGCTEAYVPKSNHEIVCSYRVVNCKINECTWSGQCRKLQSHIMSTHPSAFNVILSKESCPEMKWENFNIREDSFKYIPFIAYDQVFWQYMYMNTEVNRLCISFTHSSNCEATSNYLAVVSFKNGDIGYMYTIKIPLDNNSMVVDFFEECVMTVPGNMLYKFINEESSLCFNVQIMKE